MDSASEGLADYLKDVELSTPSTPIYANATAKPYEGDFKALITAQVKSPVRWQQTVENLAAEGVDTFIECGPGKTLVGLIKKINPELKAYKLENKADLELIKSELL